MSICHMPHCGQPSEQEHPDHGVRLCERCRALVEHFGYYPRTLGDLTSLVELAVRSFGPSKVRAALAKLEDAR